MLPQWLFYALLAAFCAALVPIFGKIGMQTIDSDLATVVRSLAMSALLIIFALAIGVWQKVPTLHGKAMLAITLSGAAGAASWIFYFRALQLSHVSKVAPIDKLSMPLGIVLAVVLLGERPTAINWLGIAAIAGGAYLATIPK